MKRKAEQFPFVMTDAAAGTASLMPYVPVSLTLAGKTEAVMGLLDTGAATNVLPFDLGIKLGASWEAQKHTIVLGGNLAAAEARVLFVHAVVAPFKAVRLVFAWTKTNAVPVILGQMNFFKEFDLFFSRARFLIEIRPANARPG